jgi:hypothetical protein
MSHISQLDQFHYHEALDRLSMMNNIIDDNITQHPVIKSFGALKAEVDLATMSLFTAYQMVGHITYIIECLDPLLDIFAKDYQFDKNSPDYLGFLNTCPEDEWCLEDQKAFQFATAELPELWQALLDKHGLDVEGEARMEETIFIKK